MSQKKEHLDWVKRKFQIKQLREHGRWGLEEEERWEK